MLAVLASFRALHLGELLSEARNAPWREVLRPDVPFRVEATCSKSRIYHSGAAAERIETAVRQALGAPPSPGSQIEAPVLIRARIEHDVCTLSVDTSGEPLHKRGYKEAIGKAPMRETLASLFLRQCGYDGTEPVVDPMCGSGTFVIEAAEIALRLNPGRARRFAFEQLATFDAAQWARMRAVESRRSPPEGVRFHGSDRDGRAISMARANAQRAGVAEYVELRQCAIGDAVAFQRELHEREEEEARRAIEAQGCEIVELDAAGHKAFATAVQPIYQEARHAYGDDLFKPASGG